MKKVLFVILIASATLVSSAQKLIDIYKSGTIKMVPDNSYAQGNNWDVVFKTYYDTIYNTPMGNRKSLVLMPDGSVVVNHTYRNYYSKFSPSGKFEKEFGILSSKGAQYKKTNSIKGIINGNTFYTGLDNMGNMICFDFEGHYRKTLKLDYMTRDMIPLPGNKIAVVGWVIWKDRFRDFVSIVDYETNFEKIVWEHFTERYEEKGPRKLFNYMYKFSVGGAMGCTTMPFSRASGISSPPQIASIDDKLIISLPISGEILVFNLDGKLVSKSKIDFGTNYLSVEDQKDIQKKAIEKYKNMEFTEDASVLDIIKIRIKMMPDSPEKEKMSKDVVESARAEWKAMNDYLVKEMESDLTRISEPIKLPAFSTLLKDSDGNLLFFEYATEENRNKFHVWIFEKEGKFVGQSSFACDDYNLEINPSKMVFHNGYIYGLQRLKNATGVPLRLVRFKITGM